MSRQVDSYRFLSFATKQLVRTWAQRPLDGAIPWAVPRKPLRDSTVALVSTAGLALADDEPFDQQGERENPWWGDPSFRVIPRDTDPGQIRIYHLHVDPRPAEQDLDCAFPLRRLADLVRSGEIGASAASHYSFMGYILRPDVLLDESTPAMIERMKSDEVDVVLLVPY